MCVWEDREAVKEVIQKVCVLQEDMAEFGDALWQLMAKRHMRKQVHLQWALAGVGYHTSPANISYYLNKERTPPRDFVRAVVKALDLTVEEHCWLCRAYFYDAEEAA